MFSFTNIDFVNPEFLLLLVAIPLLLLRLWVVRKKRFADIRMSSLEAFGGTSSLRGKFHWLLPALRLAAIGAFIVAMARPQATLKEEEITAEGIDIVLVTDVSSSMLARDFKPDRLEASKQVAMEFVQNREFDRFGLAVFAGEAFTQCPLTTDHKVINEFLSTIKCGLLEDGTAIGLGLATAVNRLKNSEAKSKVVILLTDGVNNSGEYIMPLTAAEIAREFDVKVYTIGVGTAGDAYAPIGRRGDGEYVFGFVRVEIDEALLQQIAGMTGGKYFRATNREGLENIYREIDNLEKTKIEVTTMKRYSEEFFPWVFLGMILLILEIFLRYTIFRTIP